MSNLEDENEELCIFRTPKYHCPKEGVLNFNCKKKEYFAEFTQKRGLTIAHPVTKCKDWKTSVLQNNNEKLT